MREPMSIVIFGGSADERVVRLKCLLLKCGICNFVEGQIDGCCRRELSDDKRVGLFIVSLSSINPEEMESISSEARRLAVPVLHL